MDAVYKLGDMWSFPAEQKYRALLKSFKITGCLSCAQKLSSFARENVKEMSSKNQRNS